MEFCCSVDHQCHLTSALILAKKRYAGGVRTPFILRRNTLLPAPKQAPQRKLIGLGPRYLDIGDRRGVFSTTDPYPSIHVVISETLKERSMKTQSRTWNGTGVQINAMLKACLGLSSIDFVVTSKAKMSELETKLDSWGGKGAKTSIQDAKIYRRA